MKKFILLAAFGVAGMMSAKTAEISTIKTTQATKNAVESCQWCISSGGNYYCAEAASCEEAKATARAMAISDKQIDPGKEG